MTASQLLAAMRDHGADVKTVNGWDRYGWWNTCDGVLNHHTATASASVSNPAPSLYWLMNAYDKPAANMLVGKIPGTTYLCAAGPSYHCGQGAGFKFKEVSVPAGNRPDRLFGIEIDDPGLKPNTLTDYQIENTARINAALWDFFDWPDAVRIGTHKCWTDGCHGWLPSAPGLAAAGQGTRGRKNDTIDGAWASWPGLSSPEPYNAPFWRKEAERYLIRSAPTTWDGTVPSRAAVARAVEQNVATKATWRLACRLFDLGFRDRPAQPEGKQLYPTGAVVKFQKSQGWENAHGGFSERTQKKMFGKAKP